ncbi:MAG: DUF5659 domain-containing protein [Candidatus Paceibacterota bacterium]|jgi:hypothetical protein
MENQTKTLDTSDIRTSCFLLSSGIKILKVIKSNPQKVVFCFPNNPEIKKLLDDYWNDKATTNPRLLFECLDHLKDLIHRDYEI